MPENNEVTPQQQKSAGALLRAAREARNLSLEQVSRSTHIHAHVLKALEADDTAKLGVVYTRSFLRLYADFLGLDKDEVVTRFLAAAPQAKASVVRKAAVPAPSPSRRTGLLAAQALRRLWNRLARLLCRVPWPRVAVVLLAGFLLFGAARWIKGCRARARERRAAAVSREAEAPAPARSRRTAAATSTKAEKKNVFVSAASKQEGENVALAVKALGKTWLQVKADGKIVFQSVLAKGSSESWKAREKIELWIGDAGALELEVNGRFLDRVGRRGQTLREVVITPKGLVVRR